MTALVDQLVWDGRELRCGDRLIASYTDNFAAGLWDWTLFGIEGAYAELKGQSPFETKCKKHLEDLAKMYLVRPHVIAVFTTPAE